MRGDGYYSRGGGQRRGGSHHQHGSSNNNNSISSSSKGDGSRGSDDHKEKKKRDAFFDLKKYLDKRIHVKFMGGREVTGVLKGFDQLLNIVLDDAEEIIHSPEEQEDGAASAEEKRRHVGLVVLRGPSIILLSPTDGSEEIANPFVQAE